MPRILLAGIVYFCFVFSAGFLLGALRVLVVEPILGTRWAELAEMPIMLTVMWAASGWIVRRFQLPARWAPTLAAGVIGLTCLLAFEFGLVLRLRGMSVGEYLATRDPVSGTVYYILLGVLALLPAVRARAVAST